MNRIRLAISMVCLLSALAFAGSLTLQVAKAQGDAFMCNCNNFSGLRCNANGDIISNGGYCCTYSCEAIVL